MFEVISLWQYILLALLAGMVYLVYERIVRPYQIYKFYKKILTDNYKTEVNPFTITGLGYAKTRQKELEKYGDTHHFAKTGLMDYQVRLMKVGTGILIDLVDPELIRQYYEKTKQRCYEKNFESPGLSSLRALFGPGLFMSEGDAWKKKKKILSNVFNFDFIHSKIPLIASTVSQKIRQLESIHENLSKEKVTADITHLFQKIFGTIVIKSFFGDVQLDTLGGQDIFSFINTMLRLNTKRSLTPLAFILGKDFHKYGLRAIDRKVNRMGRQFMKFSEDIINHLIKEYQEKKEESHKNGGLIDLCIKKDMLVLEGQNPETEKNKYTIREMIYEIANFFLAGTETTSTLMTSLVYILAQRPDIFTKAKSQVLQIVGDKDITSIDEQTLKKCTYLDCLIKQGLRMYNPVATLPIRSVVKEHYLGKIPMKKGLQVALKIVTNQYRSEVWKDPRHFNPDRWAQIEQGKESPFSFFPFSFGHRVCIGQHLAVLQAKIALIGIIQSYKAIKTEKQEFRMYERFAYGPEPMLTFLIR